MNMQKQGANLYTSNEQFENKIKKMISFTMPSKRIKYLGINLIKGMQYVYTEIYKKTAEINLKDTNGKIVHVYELENLILLQFNLPQGGL
jgi:glutamine cyclotransferase